ncbi:2Fe-2S iron-sulfur cluster-binding protein [Tardiphaga sp. 215_C5_N2_1]|uniref:2Fe-2S iron-sulfur cluster-binding protein n=1 Tax=Tardiphaga sp. 215_C5_N2_1 TaxID=3240774 RepID=UPI003F8A1237
MADTVEVAEGTTCMQAAVDNCVEGISGECGGCMTCGTCHVYVDPEFHGKLPLMDEAEDGILEGVAEERTTSSRLACQIVVTATLEGLIVRLPKTQG